MKMTHQIPNNDQLLSGNGYCKLHNPPYISNKAAAPSINPRTKNQIMARDRSAINLAFLSICRPTPRQEIASLIPRLYCLGVRLKLLAGEVLAALYKGSVARHPDRFAP
jgi:hypothetical protein